MIYADVMVDMDVASPRGTTLTTALLTSGTKGVISSTNISPSPITGFVLGDSKYECPDDVSIGGIVYPAKGRSSRSMAFNHNQNLRTAEIIIPGTPARLVASAAALIYFGPKNDAASGNLFDYFSFWDINGNFCVCQLDNGRGLTPGDYALNIESNFLPSPTHSAYQTINPFSWYWITIYANFMDGIGKMAIYDASSPLFPQVGSTITTSLFQDATLSARAIDRLKWGNGEIGTASSGTTISFFQHILIDYTNAVFPLIPSPNKNGVITRNRSRHLNRRYAETGLIA